MTEQQQTHKLQLTDRRKLTMGGVTEVLGFDASAVALQTDQGVLTIHGKDLQLKQLSPEGGQVAVEGTISALIYEDPRPKGWRGLFR